MARLCKIQKDKRQRALVNQYKTRRDALRERVRDQNASFEDKMLAQKLMQALPRDSSRSRLRNRCLLTGRSRGVYRKFGLARNKLRELAMLGYFPGLRKASW
jgi:small subunit ribosomal protein S14